MIDRTKRPLTLLISFLLIVSICIQPATIFAETVRGIEEPFFIQHEDRETLATNSLLTIGQTKYVPLRDVASFLNYDLTMVDGQVQLNSRQEELALQTIDSLPKQRVPQFTSNATFQANVAAQGALIAKNSSEQIMYQKNGTKTFYPASTTKMMTALLAVERGNLKDVVTVSQKATQVPADSSKAYLRAGDRLTLEQLLYAMMLPSGNDAAVAIAEHIAGSEQKFAQLMSERAKELGATKTNFVNAHGYHHPNQYTTPQDMAKIAFEVAKHPELLKVLKTTNYTAYYRDRNGKSVSRTWSTTNRMKLNSSPYYHSAIIGGKTGYTSASLHNLVSIARDQNDIYVIVVLRGHSTKRYEDTLTMLSKARQVSTNYEKNLSTLQNVRFHDAQTFVIDGRKVSAPSVNYQGVVYVAIPSINQLFGKNVTVSDEQLNKVALNNEIIPFTQFSPIIENGRMLVPFRQLFEAIDYRVTYESATKKVTGHNEDTTIELLIDSNIAYVNGEKVTLDAKAKVVKGHTLVPVRFIAETTGFKVDWGFGRTLKVN